MKHCKDCLWWGSEPTSEPGHRRCLHRRMEAVPFSILDGACVVKGELGNVVTGEPGNSGVIGTGPEFGCIHHEDKR